MGMISRNTTVPNVTTATNEEVKAAVKVSTDPDKVYFITSGFGKPMTDFEIDKDSRISRAGVWQAAASNPALLGYAADVEALKIVIRELADDGLKYINEGNK
jgi:hypothetical protein